MSEAPPSFAESRLTVAAAALLDSVGSSLGARLGAIELEPAELTARVSSIAGGAGYFVERVDLFLDDIDVLLASDRPFLFVQYSEDGRVHVATSFSKRAIRFAAEGGVALDVPRKVAAASLRASRNARVTFLARQLASGGHAGEARVVAALTSELGASLPVGWGYVFRHNEVTSIPRALRSLRLGHHASSLVALSGLQSLLTTAAWAVLGSVAIAGHAETGSLLGWALLSFTATVVQVASMRMVGRFAVRAGTVLRARLLEGALGLEHDSLGAFGLGGLMVMAIQADAFTTASIALAVAVLSTLTNVVAAVAVLSIAPLSGVMIALFVTFVVAVLLFAPRVASWSDQLQSERMKTTTDMVERMLGHSTRLVQQTPNTWHDGEDEALVHYAGVGQRLDRLRLILQAMPRAYYTASVVILFAILVSQPSKVALALALGAMTLGMASLEAIVNVVLSGGSLYALLRAIRPILIDGSPAVPDLAITPDVAEGDETRPLIELRGVRYGYPSRTKGVLDDVDLQIGGRDRVLIEGPSGGGKTTLATIMTGLRKPDAGLVLVAGLDQHTMPESELRRIVATAPQFYKNHIFTESLAFNLLLGRAWPPEEADTRAATRVARALGLGPLLDRMPSGLFQQVGETGWQLSHGEKSRVYLGRALLQRSKVLVLDETFGALDPASLRRSMQFVLEESKSVVVITHR